MIPIRFSYNTVALSFIAAFTLALILIFSSDSLVLWDEAVYIGIAKHIASAGSYGIFESFRPFVLPLMLTPLLAMGAPAIASAKILAALFAGGALFATYLLARKIGDERVGLLSVLLLATTTIFVQESMRFMTETPAAILIILSLYALASDKPGVSGLLALIAFATRYPAGIILPALLLIAFIEGGPRRAIRVAVGFALGSAVLFGAYELFVPGGIGVILDAAIHQGNPFYAREGLLSVLFYPLALIAAQPFLIAALLSPRLERYRHLLIPVLLSLIYLTLIANKQERFILMILPIISILAAAVIAQTRRVAIASCALIIVGAILSAPILISHAGHEATPLQEFFATVPLEDPSATSDPVIAAYRDVRFEPIYYTYHDLAEKARGFDTVIFSKDAYGCVVFGPECEDAIERALGSLSDTHRVEETLTYQGLEYMLLVRDDPSG